MQFRSVERELSRASSAMKSQIVREQGESYLRSRRSNYSREAHMRQRLPQSFLRCSSVSKIEQRGAANGALARHLTEAASARGYGRSSARSAQGPAGLVLLCVLCREAVPGA